MCTSVCIASIEGKDNRPNAMTGPEEAGIYLSVAGRVQIFMKEC